MLRAARHAPAIEWQAQEEKKQSDQKSQTIIAGSQPHEETLRKAEAEKQRQQESRSIRLKKMTSGKEKKIRMNDARS